MEEHSNSAPELTDEPSIMNDEASSGKPAGGAENTAGGSVNSLIEPTDESPLTSDEGSSVELAGDGENVIEGPTSPPPTWVPPGHFYSPLVDPGNRHVRHVLDTHSSSTLIPDESLQIDDGAILDTFARIVRFSSQMQFPMEKATGSRFHFSNPAFSFGDALAYFGILLDRQPRRVIEIGCGHSSCLLMDTNDRLFAGAINFTMIEPYPEALHALLEEADPYRDNLLVEDLQDVPTSVFEELQANDILFIDSSHVGKMASDVNDYFFRILPCLKPGVLIHIHDIPYPFEYDSKWIDSQNRSWNEAYFLRAFLQYNQAFKIIYFSHYMVRFHGDQLIEQLPLATLNGGASIWLEKVSR